MTTDNINLHDLLAEQIDDQAWPAAMTTLEAIKAAGDVAEDTFLTFMNMHFQDDKLAFLLAFLQFGITCEDFVTIGRFFIHHGLAFDPLVAKVASIPGIDYFEPFTATRLEVITSMFETDAKVMAKVVEANGVNDWEYFANMIQDEQNGTDFFTRIMRAMAKALREPLSSAE